MNVHVLPLQSRQRLPHLPLAGEGQPGAGGAHDLRELAVRLAKADHVGCGRRAQHVPRLRAREAHVPLGLGRILAPAA